MTRMIANEQLKLLASFFNTVAAAFVTTGVLAPVMTVVYGFGGISRDAFLIVGSSVICMVISSSLHVVGRLILTKMTE